LGDLTERNGGKKSNKNKQGMLKSDGKNYHHKNNEKYISEATRVPFSRKILWGTPRRAGVRFGSVGGGPGVPRGPSSGEATGDLCEGRGPWELVQGGGRGAGLPIDGLAGCIPPPTLVQPRLGGTGETNTPPPPRALGLDKGGDKDKIGFPGCGGVHTRRSLSVDPRSSWQSPNVVNNIIIKKSVQPDGFLG